MDQNKNSVIIGVSDGVVYQAALNDPTRIYTGAVLSNGEQAQLVLRSLKLLHSLPPFEIGVVSQPW